MIWKSKLLSQFSEIDHGSTSRDHGILRFGHGPDQDVIENRKKLASEIGADFSKMIIVNQVHGSDIFLVKPGQKGTAVERDPPEADAIVTNIPAHAIVVRTADCVPVLFFHPQNQVVAVAHAGWKGTNKKIVQEVIETMKDEYNCDSSGVFVAIGPAICGRCYDNSTVRDDRIPKFQRLFNKDSGVIHQENTKTTLDLPLANKLLCRGAGIPESQIEMSNICTFESNNHWASFRKNPEDLSTPIWSFLKLK